MKIKSLTTQWKDQNIGIQYESKNILSTFFIHLFFKKWYASEGLPYDKKVILKFEKQHGLDTLSDALFDYQRVLDEGSITTYIYKVDLIRAFIRTCYKFIFKNASVVGIPELYLAIIRKSILEPIEFYMCQKGWSLIHASVFTYREKTFVIAAGSKAGKSTLVKNLSPRRDIQVLSDNYGYLKENRIRTVEEPLRSGEPAVFKPVFYGRSINGYPEAYESKVDFVVYMYRGVKNHVQKIDSQRMSAYLYQINNKEREGIAYVQPIDPLMNLSVKPSLKSSVGTYELEVAEGLENIAAAIDQILNLARE